MTIQKDDTICMWIVRKASTCLNKFRRLHITKHEMDA